MNTMPLPDPAILDRVRVVLSHPSHPGNIGAAARAMKTMGLSRLILVNPKVFPDAQADAMAAGATDVLVQAEVVSSLAEALSGTVLAMAMTARRRELAVPALWARDGAAELVAQAAGGDVALVFGNETSGLSNDELGLCRRWAMIPVSSEFSSLNLAAAVQVMCYELRLAAIDPGAPPAISGAGELASHDEVEGLIAHIERAAISSEFLDPASPKAPDSAFAPHVFPRRAGKEGGRYPAWTVRRTGKGGGCPEVQINLDHNARDFYHFSNN
jgi:tRNA/rRNA methyltransferase